eukprot:scaffold19727_cov23-Prasinocladus_malaysianus.AAC.1
MRLLDAGSYQHGLRVRVCVCEDCALCSLLWRETLRGSDARCVLCITSDSFGHTVRTGTYALSVAPTCISMVRKSVAPTCTSILRDRPRRKQNISGAAPFTRMSQTVARPNAGSDL